MDYIKLGLKAGLEIHQQLDTGKLFSRTPSYLRSDKPDYEILRKLHPVAGETGEVDAAVAHEATLEKEFIYQGYRDSISLIELDESPPQEIEHDALNIALQIALLLNCEIYSAVQIMRKTVIDGSNTSGFQRTVLIAHSGYLNMVFRKVGIDNIALEEDSARVIERGDKKSIYRLDRLGIPLVEISTSACLQTPEQIKETALKLGEILRVCKVKRGIGTIRQDLNISIKGHDRVEIKGFQDPKTMIKTINLEIERQLNDLKNKKKQGEVRNALPDGVTEFLRPLPGKARMYPETDLPLLHISRDRINALKKEMPKLKADIKSELKRKGVQDEIIELITKEQELFDEFSTLMKVYDKDANLVGKMVSLWRSDFAKQLGKKFYEVRNILNERVLESVLEHVRENRVSKEDVREILWKILNGEKIEEALHIERVGDDELEEKIRKIVLENPGLRAGGYMGLLIKEFGARLNKRRAMEILVNLVKN